MNLEIHQLIGEVPERITLGPPFQLEGLTVREVLGDFEHLEECDRPPRYLTEDPIEQNFKYDDRGPNRVRVKPKKPSGEGLSIEQLRGTHSGACAVFFNGGSLASLSQEQLNAIKQKCPIIGMNRTFEGYEGYNGPQPDYLCLIEWLWFLDPYREHVLKHPRIINGSTHPAPVGYRVARNPRMHPFSFDLYWDGFVGPVPCTTGHLALQLAVYLGFTEVNCFGWDLQGGHFDKSRASIHFKDALRYHARQKEKLEERGIKVYVCNSPESKLLSLFPHRSYEEFLSAE